MKHWAVGLLLAGIALLAACSSSSGPKITPAAQDASYVAAFRVLYPASSATDSVIASAGRGLCDKAASPALEIAILEDKGEAASTVVANVTNAVMIYCPKRVKELSQ